MPWQKNFDEEQAVDKATALFWKHGYDATSISDLVEGTGINKGSLYNAFGGKRELFLRALLKYDRQNRRAGLTRLSVENTPRNAIIALMDGTVKDTLADTQKRGCFLVNTLVELPTHGDDVRNVVMNGLHDLEDFFLQNLRAGQVTGEISSGVDAEAASKALMGAVLAMRVMGRGDFTQETLQAVADQAKRLLD